MSRRRLAALVLGVSVASVVVGVVGGRSIRSPADAAASRRAPQATPVRVPVERRVLANSLVGRGDVGFSDAVELRVQALDAVITEAPAAVGAEVTEGSVVLEVSERPMFVLAGAVPMYRDLLPGSTGVDVRQLEAALARLGYQPGTVDDEFDEATDAAVARLYVDRGYPAPEPSEEGRARLVAARAAVEQLEGSQAGQRVEEADAAVRGAQGALAAAEARAAANVAQAGAEADAAGVARRRADADAANARARVQQGEGGHHPDTGTAPTPAELADLRATAGAADDAAEVAAGQEAGARSAEAATAVEQDAAVAQAHDAVDEAEAARTRTQATQGGQALAEAKRELAEAQRQAGAVLPRDELAFAPALPAALTVVNVALGDRAAEVLAEISGSRLVVDLPVPTPDLRSIQPGMAAQVDALDPPVAVAGQVVEVLPTSTTPGRGTVRLALTDPAATALRGVNVRVRIPLDSTDAPVLAVPVAAVVGRPDGSSWVEVERSGAVTQVEVQAGLSAEGYVAVTPTHADRLREGDLVTVGLTAAGDG